MIGLDIIIAFAFVLPPSMQQSYTVELSKFYEVWKYSMSGMHPGRLESAAWVVKTGQHDIQLKPWGRFPHANMQQWAGEIPADAIAIIHTHCRKANPRPSKVDVESSMKFEIPIYVVNDRGIWKIKPDGPVLQEEGPGWWKKILNR